MPALQTIYQHPLLTLSELETIFEAHQPVNLNKGDYLLKKGQVANSYSCIVQGMVRSYVYDFNGNDITTGFIGKDEIAIDVISLFHQIPTVEYIQALTDCKCYVIGLDQFQVLYHAIKGFNEWGRLWMSESLFQLKQRTVSMITDSAIDRYKKLQEQHPQILQQAPLKFIATYLGITDTSLSRIRKEIVKER
ncbi:CRP-like cAMP-binding protein [Pedobacter cryoconitis]|uniref:CRP-like cAMP-binding protein n=1 Tax=Pedobacter cryoconitis TaxID=188932 RepID=A0A7W8ZPT7_9SPHI|nr:Crp/Fnr family transcriptional regulator [Pedobacter cryoconitis]MBB5637981.1 CRP-like cAMP-binding protein [Pedobacter cryoconitis]